MLINNWIYSKIDVYIICIKQDINNYKCLFLVFRTTLQSSGSTQKETNVDILMYCANRPSSRGCGAGVTNVVRSKNTALPILEGRHRMGWCDGPTPVFFVSQNISRRVPEVEIAPMGYANAATATVRLVAMPSRSRLMRSTSCRVCAVK